jgi:7-keto-8-aminopelargonate synthetase-like enzyme
MNPGNLKQFAGAVTATSELDFSTNDYLGLSRHPLVQRAAIDAIEVHGVGRRGVSAPGQAASLEERLELAIAEFESLPAALTLQSGYAANINLITCIADERSVFLYDEYAHPSLVDGGRLSGAGCVSYSHLDVNHLARLLQDVRDRPNGQRAVVIATDGVFGADGEIAPLPDVAHLAESYEATLIVDDAHATGVLGKRGTGSPEHFGLPPGTWIKTGTMSKALGAAGGFIAADSDVTSRVRRGGHSILYSTGAPPATLAACLEALEVLRKDEARRVRLRENTRFVRAALVDAGFHVGTAEAAIIPVFVGSAELVMNLSEWLYSHGLLVRTIAPPRVSQRDACIRLMINSEHVSNDLETCIRTLQRGGEVFGLLG